MTFDPKTYSTLEDLRSGRWCLPGHGRITRRHDQVGRLLREGDAPLFPGYRHARPGAGVPVDGLHA